MASVTKNDIPKEANMMTELWNLIKEFYVPEDNDEYWLDLNEKCVQIYKNCPTPLTFQLVHGFLNYLEDKSK